MPLFILFTAPGLPQLRYKVDILLLPAFKNRFRSVFQKTILYENIENKIVLFRILSCSRPAWLLSYILNFDSITDLLSFYSLLEFY